MTQHGVALRAVFFDLDGTLLDLEIERFMPPYIERLTQAVAGHIPSELFQRALLAATDEAIRRGRTDESNEEAFWRAFERLTGVARQHLGEPVDRFYSHEFPRLNHVAGRVPIAADVVASVRRRVEYVVLATNPIFPFQAIAARMEWAGLDPSHFDLVTSYEVMHATKPHASYYEEICERFRLDPKEALMIGNDPELDIAGAAEAGLWTYLVDDLRRPPSEPKELSLQQAAPHGKGALSDVPAFVDLLKRRNGGTL